MSVCVVGVIVEVTLMTTGLAPQLNVTSNGSKVDANAAFTDAKVQLAAVPVPTCACPATANADVAPNDQNVSASVSLQKSGYDGARVKTFDDAFDLRWLTLGRSAIAPALTV
jgi:hypothetical protein